MLHSLLPLHQPVLYHNLLKQDILRDALDLIRQVADSTSPPHALAARLQHALLTWQHQRHARGRVWKNYIANLLWEDENVFSLTLEKSDASCLTALLPLVADDLFWLHSLYHLDWETVVPDYRLGELEFESPDFSASFTAQNYDRKLKELQLLLEPDLDPNELCRSVGAFYNRNGCGTISQSSVFYWDGVLRPVVRPVLSKLDDLVGYHYQKSVLRQNTEAFLNGRPANHILLFGEKGTGKSSSVKALLQEYAEKNLHLLELTRHEIPDLNQILNPLKNRGLRFILFLDDLSFEDHETEYKDLKSFMEGSFEATPNNLLIYATSNRRHIVREAWEDRAGAKASDLHISDTVQEKLALVDRFGITLGFYTPDQEEYLVIVEALAARSGIVMPLEELRYQALRWEKQYHGRSGRTAEQFIYHLAGNQSQE